MLTQVMKSCYEVQNYKRGDTFIGRISHVFDPSKFWIVTKPRELELFKTRLFREYYMFRSKHTLADEEIKIGLICTIYTDNSYYRGKVLSVSYNLGSSQEQILIYFLDYGMIKPVSRKHMYRLSSDFSNVPQFAVRACLAGVMPANGPIWTSPDVHIFNELHNFEELEGVVVNTIAQNLYIEVFLRKRHPGATLLHYRLISHKIGKIFVPITAEEFERKRLHLGTKFIPNSRYQYKFPTHEIIETGIVPYSLVDMEFQIVQSQELPQPPLDKYWTARNDPTDIEL